MLLSTGESNWGQETFYFVLLQFQVDSGVVQLHLLLVVTVPDVLDLRHGVQHIRQQVAHLVPLLRRLRHIIAITQNLLQLPELFVELHRVESVLGSAQ